MKTWNVSVPAGVVTLEGELTIPDEPRGIVVFAHGSGSSRRSPRNRAVAGALQSQRIATLLFDLLTPSEEEIDAPKGELRFDIRFLGRRLVAATDWVDAQEELAPLRLGYFGASTGAAAALLAAAERPRSVCAVVSRGGRPDLATKALRYVQAPTLFLVGSEDQDVLRLNEEAFARLPGIEKQLQVVPGASHLFEESGALEIVTERAVSWFHAHLSKKSEPVFPPATRMFQEGSRW